LAEKNPGRRLRTVNMLAAQSGERPPLSAEVKVALIAAMENDPNPAVRKEALESLIPYLPDEDVTRAFVHILSRDQTTGLRIAAIKALDAASFTGQPAYPNVRRALEDAAKSDDNKFIRIRAQQAIEEKKP
jgi:HEAT repeat protein